MIAEVKELARDHTGEAIETLVSIMTNPKAAPAAQFQLQMRCSTRLWQATAAHHWRGWAGLCRSPARALQNCEEWVASLGDQSSPTPSNGSAAEVSLVDPRSA